MNKEDILAMSRKEKNDEGVIYFLNEGYKYGVGIFSIISATLLIITLVLQRGTELTLLLTISFGLYAGVLYGNRKVINSKNNFTLLLCVILTIIFFVSYVKQIIG